MSVSLGELAVRFGCKLRGDPDTRIDGVAALGEAHDRAVSFLASPSYRRQLEHTPRRRRGARGIGPSMNVRSQRSSAKIPTRLMRAWPRGLTPQPAINPGVHASAIVGADAQIDPTAEVGPCTP